MYIYIWVNVYIYVYNYLCIYIYIYNDQTRTSKKIKDERRHFFSIFEIKNESEKTAKIHKKNKHSGEV